MTADSFDSPDGRTYSESTATPGQADWWVCDGPLPEGQKITGPFATQELALTVRTYIEKAEQRTDLWVDDEAQEPKAAPELAAAMRETRELREQLDDFTRDVITYSPVLRIAKTAQALRKKTGLPPVEGK